MPRAHPEGGFLLLEVLVAFAIAALALVVLLDGTSGGLRATALANRYGQAVARARSHLAAVGGRAAPLVPGLQEGDDGSGFRWRIEVTPVTAASAVQSGRERLVLYRVVVTESWKGARGERTVRLTSARLGGSAEGGP